MPVPARTTTAPVRIRRVRIGGGDAVGAEEVRERRLGPLRASRAGAAPGEASITVTRVTGDGARRLAAGAAGAGREPR